MVQKMWSYQIYGATKAIQLIENTNTNTILNIKSLKLSQFFCPKTAKRNLGVGQT